MIAGEQIGAFPQVSFIKTFEEKFVIIKSLGVSEEELDAKAGEYEVFFEYDNLLLELKKTFEENPETIIKQLDWNKINFHIGKINMLIAQFSSLNLSVKTLPQILQNFTNHINSSKYFQNISINMSGVNIPLPTTFIESLMTDLKNILKNFNVEELDSAKIRKIREGIENKSEVFTNAESISNSLIKNEKKYKDAIKIAEEWIDTNEAAVDTFLQKQASTFGQKADEHSVYKREWVKIMKVKEFDFCGFTKKSFWIKQPSWKGSFIWMISSFTFGIIIVGMLFYFLNEKGLEIGDSIIRVGAILVPTYFLLFSAQQFLLHKKLYESYKFKDISLSTMGNLIKQYTDPQEKLKILNKGIDVIFSETTIKEDGKYDKQIITEVIKMIQK